LEAVCELLLHHYDMASETAKIVRYAAMSGERAAAVFATREAMDYYQRSLSALAQLRASQSDRSMLLERSGDCLETTAQYVEAARTFVDALEEWRAAPRRPRLVTGSGGLRTREARLCRKIAVCFERHCDYDESLRWLEEALSVLPGRAGRVGAQISATKSWSYFAGRLTMRRSTGAGGHSHSPGTAAIAVSLRTPSTSSRALRGTGQASAGDPPRPSGCARISRVRGDGRAGASERQPGRFLPDARCSRCRALSL
jgi:tetratricopeptide (TPR) repeat protein